VLAIGDKETMARFDVYHLWNN